MRLGDLRQHVWRGVNSLVHNTDTCWGRIEEMRRRSKVYFGSACCPKVMRPGLSLLVSLASAALIQMPANAQPKAGQEISQLKEGVCRVFAAHGPDPALQELHASCGARGLTLGTFSSFEVVNSKDLSAMLVDVRRGNERRIFMLSISAGQPLLEDLTGQIALASGRGPMSELSGLDLDLARFEQTGAIGVREPAGDRRSAKFADLDLGQQIARERGRLGAGKN